MNLRRFNLSSLHSLVAISENGSINKAAQALNISQPAISRSIKNLEGELGIQLLERSSLGVRLTPHGEAVLRHAKSIDAELLQCLHEVRELETTGRNRVSVGGTPMVVSHILAEAVQRTLTTNHEITVSLVEGTSRHLLHQLQAGDLDFALVPIGSALTDMQFERRPIFSDHVVMVVGQQNDLCNAMDLTLDSLQDQMWILPGRQVEWRQQIEREWASMGAKFPKAVIETTSYMAINYLLGTTDAITLLSAAFFSEQIRGRQIVSLSGDWHFASRTFFLCSRPSATLLPAAEVVQRQILSVTEAVYRGQFGLLL